MGRRKGDIQRTLRIPWDGPEIMNPCRHVGPNMKNRGLSTGGGNIKKKEGAVHMHVAVDGGFGRFKAVAENGRRISFPSVLTPRTGSGDLAALVGNQTPRHQVEIVRLDSDRPESWWVGDAALAVGGTRAWDTEASRRSGYDVLVMAAMAMVGASGPVSLAVGLPLSTYLVKAERKALKSRLENLAAWVSVDGEDARLIQVASVKVFAQGVAAYAAAIAGPGGHLLAGKRLGFLDPGERTTEYGILEPVDGIVVPDEARCGSIDAGVGRAYESVRAGLEKVTGVMIPPELVEQALNNEGKLTVRGREHDLRPLYTQALRDLAYHVEQCVRHVWTDRIEFLGPIILAGGGGVALSPFFQLPGLELMPDAEYANARGYLELDKS